MSDEVRHPVLKVFSVAAVWVGGLTWGELASMAAFFYTSCLTFEWFWKRMLKPVLQDWGWVKGKPREFMESTDNAPLGKP